MSRRHPAVIPHFWQPPGPGPVNNTPVLRALEFGVILLLWLFFMWVVRAVWVEVRPLKRKRRRGQGRRPGGGREAAADSCDSTSSAPTTSPAGVYDVGEEVTVGRAPGCGVPIDYDTYASNLHARLFRLDGDLWVEDLGSTNGTWVNAVRIDERTKLQKGDLLQIGGTVFEVGAEMTLLRSGSATDTGLVRSINQDLAVRRAPCSPWPTAWAATPGARWRPGWPSTRSPWPSAPSRPAPDCPRPSPRPTGSSSSTAWTTPSCGGWARP